MSNLDKAADLIAQYEAEPGEFNPRGLAQQLADAGLLADKEQVEGRSMTTIADIPQEEQQKCVGKWCDVVVAGKRHTEVIGSVPDENGLVTLIDPNGGRAYQLEKQPAREVNIRLDLHRAWTSNGKPTQ